MFWSLIILEVIREESTNGLYQLTFICQEALYVFVFQQLSVSRGSTSFFFVLPCLWKSFVDFKLPLEKCCFSAEQVYVINFLGRSLGNVCSRSLRRCYDTYIPSRSPCCQCDAIIQGERSEAVRSRSWWLTLVISDVGGWDKEDCHGLEFSLTM